MKRLSTALIAFIFAFSAYAQSIIPFGAGGSPGGSAGQVQYNNAGAFAGMAGTSWDNTNRSLTITGATVVTSLPVFDLSQTWNAGAITFTGLKFNITDTASASASLALDIQKAAVSVFSVGKMGAVTAGLIGGGNGITASAPTLLVRQRMNGAAVNFTLAELYFEDQTSANASKYLDIKYSGVSVFGFYKNKAYANVVALNGSSLGSSSDPAFLITRGVSSSGGASGNAHGYVDNTSVARTGGIGYASFDVNTSFADSSGATNYDHSVGFQARAVFNSTGTTTSNYGFHDSLTVNAGTITSRYGGYVVDATGAGAVTNNYGFYVTNLTKGGTLNFAFYAAGNTPSFFGGGVRVGTTTLITSTVALTDGAGASAGTITNAPSVGNPTKWIPINDNGTTRYIPAW